MLLHPLIQSVRINAVHLVQMADYEPLFHRNYQAGVTPEAQQQFLDITGNGRSFDVRAMASVTNTLFRPNAQAAGQAIIQNGFRAPRFAVIAEIEAFMIHSPGIPLTYLVTGYTDHNDIVSMQSQLIDPEATVTINGVTCINTVACLDVYNRPYQKRRIKEVTQVIPSDLTAPNIYVNPRQQQVGFDGNTVSSNAILATPRQVFYAAAVPQQSGLVDGRAVVCNTQLVSRQNNDVSHYAASIFQTYDKVRDTVSDATTQEEIYRQAASAQADPNISENPVLFSFNQSNPNFKRNAKIHWKTLMNLDPSAFAHGQARVNLVQKPAQMTQLEYSQIAGDQTLGGGNLHDVMAAKIFLSFPNIISKLGFSKFHMFATNRIPGGNGQMWNSLPVEQGINSFLGQADISDMVQGVLNEMEWAVLAPLSQGGLIDYDVTIIGDMRFDLRIKIVISGSATYEYVFPMFCDAVVNPMVTFDNANTLKQIAYNVDYLIGQCTALIPNAQQPVQLMNPAMGMVPQPAPMPGQVLNQQPIYTGQPAPPAAPAQPIYTGQPAPPAPATPAQPLYDSNNNDGTFTI